ncbi:MAG: tetratricopeptide repeat protein [Promethearchaeota archaeon]
MSNKIQDNSDQKSVDIVRLKVEQEVKRDKRKNRVRIHLKTMDKLGVRPGGIVSIKGNRESAAIVWFLSKSLSKGTNIINMNPRFRINTETEIGDYVEVKKVNLKYAKEVVLAPLSIYSKIDINPIINHPITIGDYIFKPIGFNKEIVRQVVEMKPENMCIGNRYTKVKLLNEPIKGSLDSQEETIKKVLPASESNVILWDALAKIKIEKGEFESAYEALRKELEILKNPSSTWLIIGIYLQQKGDNNRAMDAYKKAIEEDPHDKDANILLGYLHILNEEYDTALKIYDHVLSFYPSSTVSLTNLCHIYRKKGELDRAIEVGERALDYNPIKETWANLGIAYYKRGDYKIAVKHLKKAVKKDKSFKKALYYLAQTYFDMKQFDKALDTCNKCLKIDPDYEDAQKLYKKLNNRF